MDGKAVEMCARARELQGTLPDPRHCNRMFRLLVERRRWEDACKLYDEMLAEEGDADNYSTCVMARGLCWEGRVEEGRKLIEARWGAGCINRLGQHNASSKPSAPTPFRFAVAKENRCATAPLTKLRPQRADSVAGHYLNEFDVTGEEPKDEVQNYTWKDATLCKLTD